MIAEGSRLRRVVQRSGTTEDRHDLALWHLLWFPDLASLDAALQELTIAADLAPENPSLWIDLSALQGLKASLTQDPRPLQAAFHAAERAARLDPDRPEALFNRAWVLDLLQAPRAAEEAWELYLQKESPSSPWREEALDHLERLRVPTLDETWNLQTLDRELDAGRLDGTRLADLVSANPARALEWAMTSLLPGWGESWEAGDSLHAESRLHSARILADLFEEKWNDSFLAEGVAGIEAMQAQGSRQRIADLALALRSAREALHHFEAARPGRALESLKVAVPIFRQDAGALEFFVGYVEGASLFSQGHYAEAEARLQGLEDKLANRPYPFIHGKILHLRGNTRYVIGDPEGGLRLLQQALPLFESLSDVEHIAYVNTLLGECYDELGDRALAWRHFYRALKEIRKLGRPYRSVQIYNSLADFTLRTGDPALSYIYQNAAVQASASLDNPSFAADVLLWRALLHARFGEIQKASLDLQAAAGQAARIADPSRTEQYQADLGLIAGAISWAETPAQAVQSLDRAVSRYRKIGHRPSLLLAYEARAQAFHRLGDTAREKADLLRSLELYERIGKDLSDDGFRIGLAGLIESAFDQMVRLEAVEEKNPDRAVYFLERSRTVSWPQPHNEPVPTEPLSFSEIEASLPERGALAEYAVLEDRLLIWVHTAEGLSFYEVPLGREEIERLVARFVGGNWQSPRWQSASADLYDALLGPWFDAARFETLVLVPDESLFRLSFAALWNRSTRRYLVEDAATVIAPSASFFAQAEERDRKLAADSRDSKILVVADPALQRSSAPGLDRLDRARAEGENIRRLFPESTILLSGAQAVSAKFFELAPEARWIHFAGHAVASPERPLESFLVFAPAENGKSGSVTGKQIQDLSLSRTRMVVLAACSTAAGPGSTWPGALSLARPFLTAGVPTVLGTLWPVADGEAQSLFETFYREMRAGRPPAAALRAAQIRRLRDQGPQSVRKSGWPAFQLIGGPAGGHFPKEGAR